MAANPANRNPRRIAHAFEVTRDALVMFGCVLHETRCETAVRHRSAARTVAPFPGHRSRLITDPLRLSHAARRPTRTAQTSAGGGRLSRPSPFYSRAGRDLVRNPLI